jgi:hypothetical protein
MKDLFIVDIETTGLSYSDMTLEFVILQIVRERGFYKPGRYYRRVFHYSHAPEGSFAKSHHLDLYEEARQADSVPPSLVNEEVESFFESCDSKDYKNRVIVGSRLSFKLELLDKARLFFKPQTMEFESGSKSFGHYFSTIDLYGVESFVSELFEEHKAKVKEKMTALKLQHRMPQGRRHRALYDAFLYLNRLNEYRLFFVSPWESVNEKFFEKNCLI